MKGRQNEQLQDDDDDHDDDDDEDDDFFKKASLLRSLGLTDLLVSGEYRQMYKEKFTQPRSQSN